MISWSEFEFGCVRRGVVWFWLVLFGLVWLGVGEEESGGNIGRWVGETNNRRTGQPPGPSQHALRLLFSGENDSGNSECLSETRAKPSQPHTK